MYLRGNMIPIGATHKMQESFYKLKKVRGEVFGYVWKEKWVAFEDSSARRVEKYGEKLNG